MMAEKISTEIVHTFDQLNNWVKTPFNEQIKRISNLAHNVFQVPIVTICLNDDRRYHFESNIGTEKLATKESLVLEPSEFEEQTIIIANAFKGSDKYQSVIDQIDPKVRFYFNMPIYDDSNRRIGQFILADFKPKDFNSYDQSNLDDIKQLLRSELNNFQLSVAQRQMLEVIAKQDKSNYLNDKTGLWNYEAFKTVLAFQIKEALENNTTFGCAVIDIDGLEDINQKYGEEKGDEVIQAIAGALVTCCRANDTLARSDLHDFICLIHANQEEHIRTIIDRMVTKFAELNILDNKNQPINIKVNIGVALHTAKETTPQKLINVANAALMVGKKSGDESACFL